MNAEHNNHPESTHHRTPLSHGDVNCQQLRELIPAYSIRATDPEETALVESMLPFCPEAAAELTDYLVLADEFLYLPTDAPRTRGHLDPMPQLPILIRTPAKLTQAPKVAAARPQKRPVRRSQWLLPLSVAAVFVVIVLGASTFYWINRVQSLQNEQLALALRLQEAQIALLPLTSGQVHHRELLPNQAVPVSVEAHATLIWETAREVGSVYVTGLPPLTPDKTYQFWLVRDGGAVSLGTFRVDETGIGTLVFEAPEPIEEFQHIGISEEPATGSPMPTTPHLVIGNI